VYFWDVAHGIPIDMSLSRVQRINALIEPLNALIQGETSGWANLSNASSALHTITEWHWVGFYLVDRTNDNLVLGPFQGPVACTRLFRGKGVCASAWETNSTQVVADVESFPGHVACSAASKSEVVLPIRNDRGEVVAVWDIDSDRWDDFSPSEVEALERLAQVVSAQWDAWTWEIE